MGLPLGAHLEPSINLFEINPYTPSLPSRHKEYFCNFITFKEKERLSGK